VARTVRDVHFLGLMNQLSIGTGRGGGYREKLQRTGLPTLSASSTMVVWTPPGRWRHVPVANGLTG